MLERFHMLKDRLWQRFVVLARGPHALFWLGVCAITDPIFFPIAPEIYLAALMIAHPTRWKFYLVVATVCSFIGAGIGYFVGAFLFHQFGMPLLHFYHLDGAFREAQHILGQHVFIGMILVAFQLIPEKVFVLAGGFLGAPFLPFMAGFFIGRVIRLSVTVYLTHRFGAQILTIIQKYFLFFTVLLLAILAYYGIVHWHLLPW
jgi:membrane protein YqaA with SNARE-associated domain